MYLVFSYIFLFLDFLKISDTCPLEYRVTDPNHSFCSQPFPTVIDQPVTSSDREHILELHNHERRLARGTNIEKMYWNDDLAEIALRYARTCVFEHDKASQRSVPKIPLSTGQNLAMGYENWTETLEGWIEEKEHYYHTLPSTNIFSHYTQMIWHSSVLIGCAATLCPPFGPNDIPWRFFVCNYIKGMLNSNYHSAFEQTVEDHPLRDCQGKVCLYNGILDLNTCECQCSTYTSGSQCENLNCSNLPSCPYHSSISCIAVNVPLECPGLCGLCDRYEILKRVYGEDNLITNEPMTTFITTESSSTRRRRTTTRKRKNRTRISTTPIVNTTTPRIVLLSSTTTPRIILASSLSSTRNPSYHMIVYLYIQYLFVV